MKKFIDNVIREKKDQFKAIMGKEQRVENMIEERKYV